MRFTNSFIPTQREIPAEAENISHQLMLRAALIQQIAAGVYAWLPLGYRAHQNAQRIVREEQIAAGAQEFHLPALSPTETWEATGRVAAFGDTLFHIKNRPGLVLAPTHEEMIATVRAPMCAVTRNCPKCGSKSKQNSATKPAPKAACSAGGNSR